MNFRQLALKNIRGNWHQYGAFFWSSVFSVMIFYMYSSFIFHPDVINGKMPGASQIREIMIVCDYVIMIFSFFFILYSMSAFFKSRKKEFGLLTLFGMTKGQIRWMVLYENVIISILAISAGIGIGALFSKLFFMGLTQLLKVDSPIAFVIPLPALLFTAAGFFLLFLSITLLTLVKVGRSQIIDLLKASKQPKKPPVYSIWLALLAFCCLGAAYYMAYQVTIRSFIVYFMPVVFLTVLGTYFLYTQGSVFILGRLQKNKSFYYKQTNLLTVAQLVFKLKDNARLLFMVSILSAVVLSASGTVYVFLKDTRNQILEHYPQSITFTEVGLNSHRVIDPEILKRTLKQENQEIEYEIRLAGIPVTTDVLRFGKVVEDTLFLVSEEDYNVQAKRMNKQELSVDPGNAAYVFPYKENNDKIFKEDEQIQARLKGKTESFVVRQQLNGSPYPAQYEISNLLVMDKDAHKKLMSETPDEEKSVIYGYELKNWESSLGAVKKLKALVPESKEFNFTARVEQYQETKQLMSLTLFIGIFISFLFFIASGSMIYFKLFTEIEEDQEQFRALNRIGMSDEEMKRTISKQVGIIFFLPMLVGILHTVFAMKALGNILVSDIWSYAAVVLLIFVVMQTVYYLAARRSYIKRILQGAAQ
ncbi:ABC transporter permease [Paenibacillus sp. FJAT-26967]|uniref:ABC transporter permease n=1 Tax=Paenibacillus sp. FJAT-26967 TaxID=1729690 RepID=UPI000838DCD5|nr:ABC transporter permease [Paenibacillus sp. FJAT-26967]